MNTIYNFFTTKMRNKHHIRFGAIYNNNLKLAWKVAHCKIYTRGNHLQLQ